MSGSEPTHRELLDWLARDFVEHDWRVKRAIQQIMMSSVYRQASSIADSEPQIAASPKPNPQSAIGNPKSVDPENHLLWRARLRRLEAEVIRDSILAVSGKLDGTMGGPPVPLEYHPDGSVTVASRVHGSLAYCFASHETRRPSAGSRRSRAKADAPLTRRGLIR